MSVFSEPGTAREEAEKLVATVLAVAAMAANANPSLSNGSAECCVCPFCKVIAAVRDPDPEMVERIATGAGDLAAGFASFMRHVAMPDGRGESVWKHATSHTSEPEPAKKPPVKKVAKKVVKKTVKKAAPKEAG